MTSLQAAFHADRFALTAQLRLHQDDDADSVLRQARAVAGAVDAVAVTDCPYGVLHMAGLAVASLLRDAGIDPVLQLTARDRNRIALKSELLGAAALGVNSFVLQRGDPLPADAQPDTQTVFDTGAKRLVATARQLSRFREQSGHPALLLGTLATVFDPPADWRPQELIAKTEAGADFVQTQLCLDVDLLRRYMQALVASHVTWRCRVIVSLPVLTSAEAARWLFENLRGGVVPEGLVQRFEAARDPVQFGIDLTASMLDELKTIPGVCGANLSTTGPPEAIVAAVTQAMARPSSAGGT
ncbi:MAG: methylenetetrahydrofolate reductase [Pseudomonadota bacterium]